ncbi:helicase associated domain-containing protein [Arthrobacter caoxuetaonis]|uniref:Helicase associated domain-containing protein n=1 Tax=Arthrobacter caoxuetaonis TaxID=2886935 RepID=A0A9X1SGI4_9MICC|nr:helicase associated domain-containing protein [Arthrobacter caoxuetaonis]MCC3299399.1 helicase associated domain-containing protein [Arthrobacter caoxuetaonis]USQ59108.1 helicase associated domain-containing protein [Arthrobacter caoxuetaonis]
MTTPAETTAEAKVPAPPTPRHNRIWTGVFNDFTAWVDAKGAMPKRRTTDAEEYRLANWLNVQRANHRAGKLHEDYVKRLSTIPGAFQTRPTRTHRQWAEDIAAFYAKNGRLPGIGSSDQHERSLGHYLNDRLRPGLRAGIITAGDIEPIADIPGTVVPARKRTSSDAYFRDLQEYAAKHGRMPGWKDSRPLARWVRRVLTASENENTYRAYREGVAAVAAQVAGRS